VQKKYHILIIDDDELDRIAIKRAFRNSVMDSYIKEVVSSKAGIEYLKSNQVDCVLLDYRLPDADGIEVLKRMRDHGIVNVPVIVFTGVGDESLALKCLECGAQDYLIKNEINANMLMRSIRYSLERKYVETELIDSQKETREIIETAHDAFIGISSDNTVNDWNSSAETIFGWSANEIKGALINGLFAEWETIKRSSSEITECLSTAVNSRNVIELTGIDNNKNHIPVEVSIWERSRTTPQQYYAFVRDIGHRKDTENRLLYLAERDPLTGLYNRTVFNRSLTHAIERSNRNNMSLAILLIDLDQFKYVNDSLGHAAGDELLKVISQRLKNNIRKVDIIARLGGDEFLILLEDITSEVDALAIADKLMKSIEAPVTIDCRQLYVTLSAGIATYPDCADDGESLIQCADVAMYQAKAEGRNQCRFYSNKMHSQVINSLSLESDIKHALKRQEFYLVYQPQLAITSNKIKGMEALLRWNRMSHSQTSPTEFIPVAESMGVMAEVTEWVLQLACEQLYCWRTKGLVENDAVVAINLSPTQLKSPSLVRRIQQTLDVTKLSPGCLELEITENALIEDAEGAEMVIRRLLDLGVRVSIDDFGTGYSSFRHLQILPFHTLKVDQSFVQNAERNCRSKVILQSMIQLGRALNINVIAEGVETAEQYEILKALSCDQYQGFYFSHPLDVKNMSQFLATRLEQVYS